MKVWSLVAKALEAHGRCALVSVARTAGSAPRDTDARMIVTPDGFHGTIGGGTLEWRALAEAQTLLDRGPTVKSSTYSLGPDLGQCCGGRVELTTEVMGAEAIAKVRALASAEDATDDRRRLYLFGAGHVGRSLVLALAPLPFDIHWIDPRPQSYPRAVPQNVTLRPAADPVAELSDCPEGSLVFVMSHSHALDLAITDAALRHPRVAYVGLIGSATKRARFDKRLREAQVPEARIAQLICPIGVPGIRSKAPAMIAAATAAQMLMLDEQVRAAAVPTEQSRGLG